ncbi:protein PELPK1-like [Mangifera indica]|uniref:protein PELPK1-like n=1 Tax=Mangifera indica TaxID=29780 RepID=UPI001CFA6079|nr:protein PELPK1-like [Mangifera indica]
MAAVKVSILLSLLVALSLSSFDMSLAARHLLDTPVAPPPALPTIPPLPKATLPPLPSIPTLPKATLPPLPSTPLPTLPKPTLPPLPNLTVPKLTLPPLPSTPLPTIPTRIPSIPLLSPPPSN